MSGTTVSGTILTGVTLSGTASNPVTIASGAAVSNTNAAAISADASAVWSITNSGQVKADGTAPSSIGILLNGSGTITNQSGGVIAGYYGAQLVGGSVNNAVGGNITGTALTRLSVGVFVAGAGSTNNAGTISAPGSIQTYAVAITGTASSVTNVATGTITSGNVGILLTSSGTVNNAGSVASTAVYSTRQGPKYIYSNGERAAVDLRVGGLVTNTGTVTILDVGIKLSGAGTVINSGSVASNHPDTSFGAGYAGVYLTKGGSVTNLAGGHITAQWKGVAIGYRPNSGTISPTITGTITNDGYIFASNAGPGVPETAGAAVWIHTPGIILNDATGTIAGGPYGIVAYYDTTVVNSGTITGTQFSVFQSSTLHTNRVEMAPGAVFTGLVEGGASGATAALGTLELLAGGSAGTVTQFGTQYTGFSTVQVDAGGTWALGGTVSATQSVIFTGSGQLTLSNPTQVQGTLTGLATGNQLVLHGITGVTSAVVNASDQLVVSAGSSPLVTLQLDPARHDPAGTTFRFLSSGTDTILIACFAEGTRIATETGDVAVEALRPGMRVRSPFGGSRAIVWTGHRVTECRRHPRPHDVNPVRVQASAFAQGVPARDVWLSPDHAVFAGGVLVPVRYLVNGRSIAQVAVERITYWHVELERHDVLLAEGLPCESYLDTGNRSAFVDGGPALMLHPDFARQDWQAKACAELLRDGPRLAALRATLLERAGILGHALSDDAGLALLAGGRALAMHRDGAWVRASVPAGAVQLLSRTWVPAETAPRLDDTRRLGVAVADLSLNGAPLALDDARLAGGWHIPEADWRWTDGAARLDLVQGGVLAFRLAMPGRYWVVAPGAAALSG